VRDGWKRQHGDLNTLNHDHQPPIHGKILVQKKLDMGITCGVVFCVHYSIVSRINIDGKSPFVCRCDPWWLLVKTHNVVFILPWKTCHGHTSCPSSMFGWPQ